MDFGKPEHPSEEGNGSGGSVRYPNQAREESAAASEAPPLRAAETIRIDPGVIVRLLRNPQYGRNLHPEQDFVYGFIGLAASVLGFFLWGLALQERIRESLNSLFGGFDLFGVVRSSVNIAPRLFLMGLISTVALLGAVWLVGIWKGQRKLNWKEVITYFGSMQLISGVCFIAAAVLVFLSYQLSFFLMTITLLTLLILMVVNAHEWFDIQPEERFLTIASSMAIYALLTGILIVLLI